MNLSFSKAVYCDTQGNEYYFENLFVQARNIRYVHIPENVSKRKTKIKISIFFLPINCLLIC